MARKRDFDAFYYGVGMKLDEKSIEQAGQQIEGKLNQVVDNVKENLKSISDAVNKGVKDIDTKGLVSALVDAQRELGHFNDFNPKELKGQIDSLRVEFNGLQSTLGDVADSIKGFKDLSGFISDVATRLSAIEIVAPKMGKDALKRDIKEISSIADLARQSLTNGLTVPDEVMRSLDRKLVKLKQGFQSIETSGNSLTLFTDGGLAKDLVHLVDTLSSVGAPVENVLDGVMELTSKIKGSFKSNGIAEFTQNVSYQIEEFNYSIRKSQKELEEYERKLAELPKAKEGLAVLKSSDDYKLLDQFDKADDVERALESIIAKIKEYRNEVKNLTGEEQVAMYRDLVALTQATEKRIRSSKSNALSEKWSSSFSGDAEFYNAKIDASAINGNKLGTLLAEKYNLALNAVRDTIKDQIEEIKGDIVYYQEEIDLLLVDMAKKTKENKTPGRPQGSTNKTKVEKKTTDVAQATGEKFVVSPEIQIDAKKWAQQINDILADISNPETGKLKPINLRINTQKTQLEKDLNQIWRAIEDTLKGTRSVHKKDADDNPVSAYETAFDGSFKSFMTKLKNAKTELVGFIDTEWKPKLKDALNFEMKIDDQKKVEAKTQIGASITSYIDALNEVIKDKPVELKSNIDALIEEIKTKTKNIKIEGGQVDFKAGDINTSNLGLDVNTSGLAKDDTVRQIYDLLASRGGGVYAGTPIYIGATSTSGGVPADVKIVEAKAEAEEKGAEAVKKKVKAESKSSTPPKATKDGSGFDKQQIYNETNSSIKETLDSFTDVKSALDWVKDEARRYSEELKNAKEGTEEYFRAQTGLNTLLHQWRYKIGNGDKSKEPFRYKEYLGGYGKQGRENWATYLKDSGLEQMLPKAFELMSKTAYQKKYDLEEPKAPKKQSSSAKSKKIEETAEEMIARDFEHTKKIAEHVLKLAKWAKALGAIADGLDYTLTEADFKDRDTVKRGGVTWTKADLYKDGYNGERLVRGKGLTADALNKFVAEYENSEDEEFKELFGFVKDLIEANRASQERLNEALKSLAGTDVATKYDVANDKSEYLSKGIKASFGRMMAKNANKDAQVNILEVLSRYGMLDTFQSLSSEKDSSVIFKTLQDNILSNKDFDKMISDLTAVDGNMGKSYESFVNLLKISKEFMLTSNSLSNIGQEALKWIGGTREQRDKYKKVFDPKTGRSVYTDEKIGVSNEVVEKGLRQMIQEFAAIFIDESGNRAFGFNEGSTIVDNFLPASASFTKIIDFLERALDVAVDIQTPQNRGMTKDYAGIRKHERIGDMQSAVPNFQAGIIKKTEAENVANQIQRSQEMRRVNEESLQRLRAEMQETVSEAENVNKILELAAQKDAKRQSIDSQKRKVEEIQKNIQTLENQLVNPAESFESIATQLLQKQEALLEIRKQYNSMPNESYAEQVAREKIKEQIKREESQIRNLQDKMKSAQRDYQSEVALNLIEQQSLNVSELEKIVVEKELDENIISKTSKLNEITKLREAIKSKIDEKYQERKNIKPQLSVEQQGKIAQYEKNIAKIEKERIQVSNQIKELETKNVASDNTQLVELKNKLEALKTSRERHQGWIKEIQADPKGEYTQEQIGARQKIDDELQSFIAEASSLFAQEKALELEMKPHNREVAFLKYIIKAKKNYIKSLQDASKTKPVMSNPEEIQTQLDTQAQVLAQAQAEQEKLQSEYTSMQGSEDEIINRELENLRTRKTEKEARIKEIDATKDAANNEALQAERKSLEAEIAQIDKHINEGLIQTIVRIKAEMDLAQKNLDDANKALANQEARLKEANKTTAIYTKGGKTVSRAEAENLLSQAQSAKDYAEKELEEIKNKLIEEATNAMTLALEKEKAGELSTDARKKFMQSIRTQPINDAFVQGKTTEKDYIEQLTKAYIAMRSATSEADITTARADAEKIAKTQKRILDLEREIVLLNEILALEEKVEPPSATPETAPEPKKATKSEVKQPIVQRQTDTNPQIVQPVEQTGFEVRRDISVVDSGLATAENQRAIIDLLKSGIKVNGKVTTEKGDGSGQEEKPAKKKVPKIPSTGRVDVQADEIDKLGNINKDSNVYKRYESLKAQLNDALKVAEEKGDAFSNKDADRIRGLMTNITQLGKKIIDASNAFEQLKERGVEATSYTEASMESLEAEMLRMAHNKALDMNALISDVSYDDVKQSMTYVLTDLEGQTTRVTQSYNEMFGAIITRSDKTTDSVRRIYKAIEGEMTKMVEVGNLTSDVSGNPLLKNSDEYTEYTKAYDKMFEKANEVRAKGTLATKEEKNELISLVKQVEVTRGAFEKMAKASADFDAKVGGSAVQMDDSQSLEMQMKNYVLTSQEWTASQRRMIDETWKFNDAQNSAAYSVEKNKGQLASMSVVADMGTKRIGQYTEETKKYKSGMEKFMDSLKNKWQEVARYLMTFGSLYRVLAVLKQGITYIKEIDSALTELKKVTDETEESYERFLNTAAKTADKVGSTIKEIVSSTADWARIGYSLKDAATLAESTAILLNVSEFQSIDEATSALTSTLQAFSYTAEQSMDVVDVLNEVGNNFAVSSDGIATALKDSASSLVAANNSYEEAVALIASANRVVKLCHIIIVI